MDRRRVLLITCLLVLEARAFSSQIQDSPPPESDTSRQITDMAPRNSSTDNAGTLPLISSEIPLPLFTPLAETFIGWDWTGWEEIPQDGSWIQFTAPPPSGLPANAFVTKVEVHHKITHPYIGDLEVAIANENTSHLWMVRDNIGGSADNINETRTEFSIFDGDSPDQDWYYRIRDTFWDGDYGFISVLQLYVYYDTPGGSLPDLTPYQPGDWDSTLVISNVTGTTASASVIYHDESIYVDYSCLNMGTAGAGPFKYGLYVDGVLKKYVSLSSLASYYYNYILDSNLGTLSAGTHTYSITCEYENTVTESTEPNNTWSRTFPNTQRPVVNNAEIHGTKFNDLNQNGAWDAGEPSLPNWQIYLDLDASGSFDAGEPNTFTNASGQYAFTQLAAGSYIVAEVQQSGWQQSHPASGGGASAMQAKPLPSITTTGSRAPVFIQGEIPTPLPGQILPMTVESSSLINLDDFRADPRFAGINGSGCACVILDTGIDCDHPFFGPDYDFDHIADRIVYSYDFADDDDDPSDVDGHGSNVASIIASQDAAYKGMAPAADIIPLKVFPDSGNGEFSYVEQALQWVVANAAAYNIVSVNMSLGDSENYTSPVSPYGIGDELAALAALNVIVVSASGNDFYSFSGQMGVSYPAADINSLSIGAVYDSNSGGWTYGDGAIAYSSGPDRICPFSQRHPTMTTVFAPGAPITGANENGGTVTMHGTSQASPHIAGIAALAQQLALNTLGRKLTPSEFSSLLRSTAATINDGDDESDNVTNTGEDFPRIDVFQLGQAILAMILPGTHSVTLTQGQILSNIDFGNFQNGSCGDWGYYPADINFDCRIDQLDLDIMDQNWLRSDCQADNDWCDFADINRTGMGRDGKVNLLDFQTLALQWLLCTDPQIGGCDNVNP